MSFISRFCGAGAGKRGPSSRTYIDLTDLVGHANWLATGAGIQRVQLEVATALVRADPNAVPFSLYGDTWRDLRPLIEEADGEAARFYPRLREYFPYPGARPSLMRPAHSAKLLKARLGALRDRLSSRTPQLNAADTLFIGGAFWMSRSVIRLCGCAAAKGANLIVLFHDLIPVSNPPYTGHDFAKEYLEVLRLPAHFIVTTRFNLDALEATRKGIGAPQPAAVSIVPLADEFPGAERNERTLLPPKQLAGLAERAFVLCVGTVEVRKNHLMLLSVWDELQAELGDRLPMLVVAGRRGWKAEAALRKLDDLPHSGSRIVFAEAPSDDALRWLYSACLFTIFPSLFEGWGLPVGESLWFGKACAASNANSIPVVGRDLCLYFSPDDPQQMKAAIRQLLDPEFRRSCQIKIESAPLRTWAEVASDIAGIITHHRPAPVGRKGDAKVSALEGSAF